MEVDQALGFEASLWVSSFTGAELIVEVSGLGLHRESLGF